MGICQHSREAARRTRGVGLLEAGDLILGQSEVNGGKGVIEVPVLGDADDRRGDDRIGQHSGQRDLRTGNAMCGSDLGYPGHDLSVALGAVELSLDPPTDLCERGRGV